MSKDSDQANLPPSGDQVSLWARLKEHRVAQWSVGYVAVAYGIQHAVTLTSEAFEWPNLVVRISMLVLILGLPVAMALAWYHGERVNRRVTGPELAIMALLLVGLSALFYVFVRPSEQIAARPAAPQQAAATQAAKPVGISVAVLPFLNLSSDKDQEFFSDGMTEEITSALAKVKGLNVVARTSAFAFKGKNEDVRTIGQSLSATDVIEGSVRKAGSKVRITAQLIRADTGDHLWTESYDRDLKDVFAVQEEIAQAIAGALQVPLGLKPGEQLVSNRTADTDSYQDYLRALALYRSRDIGQAIAILEPMVRRDPGYAPAWALLSEAYSYEPTYVIGIPAGTVEERRAIYDRVFSKAEAAARQAVRLDPNYAPGYSALGEGERSRWRWAEAEDNFRKALALDPTDPETLHSYAFFVADVGQTKQALKTRTELHALEPFVPVYNMSLAGTMQQNGDLAGSIGILEKLPPDGVVGAQRDRTLAWSYAAQGRYALAAEALLAISPNLAAFPLPITKEAANTIRKAPARISADRPTPLSKTAYGWVYAYVGAPERLLDLTEYQVEAGYASRTVA